MPQSRSLLWQHPGKTLWSIALMCWLAASPAQAEDLSWVFDVAHAHIASEYAWPESDYHLRIARQDPDRVVVYVRHKDDEILGKWTSNGTMMAGGGKSFDLYLSRKTHGVIREIWEQ